jgi:multidrug efflux pump
MASSVATPLERQFGRISAVTEMTSMSSVGSTRVVLQFDLSRNIDAAARDVQAAINAARGNLPANLPGNPSYRKVNPADAPILIIALTSDIVSRGEMYDLASSVLAQKISQVNGIGQVVAGGGALPAVRVELNPAVVNKYGISMDRLRAVLGAANANRPKGQLADERQARQLSATDQLFKASEYMPLIAAYQNGRPVRLSDLGDVTDSVEDVRNMGLANGKPSVFLILFRQPAANIIDTVDRVYAILPQLRAAIPPTIQLKVMVDRTTTIRASVNDVEATLLISIALVILVVFVFLRNPVATLIPSVVVPLSLLGTCAVMYLAGYSLDNLSLMALTVSTGFVVDDAIVVIENITRYLEQGMSAMEASLKGSSEVGFTVLSMSTSLVAVFIPILLMSGIVGRLFREFAVTLSAAIGVSMVVSLTATPMMCAHFLKHDDGKGHGRLYLTSERLFKKALDSYAAALRVVLDHPAKTLSTVLLALTLNILLFIFIPKGFFPQQDTGRLNGSIQGEQDISFQAMRDKLTFFVSTLMADPTVADAVGFCGGGGTNTGSMFAALKDRRKDSVDDVIARIRRKTAGMPGARLLLQAVQDIKVGGRSSGAQYQYTLQDADLPELTDWAPRVMAKLRTLPQVVDVNTDQQNKGLEAWLTIDRDAASRLGLTAQNIDDALYDAFGQRQVSTMYKQINQYHVIMEVAPQYWQNPSTLQTLYARTTKGQSVPLAAFTKLSPRTTPLVVNHQGFFPAVTLSFNLPKGVALGQAVDAITVATAEMRMPKSIIGKFAGTAQAFQDSLAGEPILILTALIAVYIVLGMLYESFIHPVTILSTLPSAGVGALLALIICRTELSIIAVVGIILLIGIVKKNGIMMIDFALDVQRREGKSPRDAIFEACMLRFRPIMMTTMAALLGALPLAFGRGTGSEMRRPLGIAIVGGLIVSQMLTLLTTPVVYLYMERFQHWTVRVRSRLLTGAPAATAPGA